MNPARRPCGSLLLLGLASAALLSGCASSNPPLPTVEQVDLDRFMGDWRVIALIPNRIEKNAHDSLESYDLRDDGKIDITYTYRDGSFEAPLETLEMVAWVVDEETHAEWRVRPFWPVALKYLVIDLADDYRYTVIGHPSRNYVWIMAREKTLSEDDWSGILERLVAQGFDPERIVRVPQSGPGDEPAAP